MEANFMSIPKPLISSEEYRGLSHSAILLYGLLFDRFRLSVINRADFTDENGRIFIYYTSKSVCQTLQCGEEKTSRIFKELESAGLITRIRRGLGKPTRIYVRELLSSPGSSKEDSLKRTFPHHEKAEESAPAGSKASIPQNHGSDSTNLKGQTPIKAEVRTPAKSVPNNNYIINNESNNTTSSTSITKNSYEHDVVAEHLKEQVEFDIISERDYGDMLNELIMLMTDAICSVSPTAKIDGSIIPRDMLRKRFFSLHSMHIEYVIDRFKDNKCRIYNIKSYLLSLLYNAPSTMECYYDALVRQHYAEKRSSRLKNTQAS